MESSLVNRETSMAARATHSHPDSQYKTTNTNINKSLTFYNLYTVEGSEILPQPSFNKRSGSVQNKLFFKNMHIHLRKGDVETFKGEGFIDFLVHVEEDAPIVRCGNPGAHYHIDGTVA